MLSRGTEPRLRNACHAPRLFSFVRGVWRVGIVLALVSLGGATSCTSNEALDESSPLASIALANLDGTKARAFPKSKARFVAFIFTRTDCPISNRYAPEVQRLCQRFRPMGVEFVLVYPDASQSPAEIREHLDDYGYPCRVLRDPGHELVQVTGASITPEVALYDRRGSLLYRGRIDDRYADFGKARRAASTRDFENALVAVTSGQPVAVAQTEAVGCFISDLPVDQELTAVR